MGRKPKKRPIGEQGSSAFKPYASYVYKTKLRAHAQRCQKEGNKRDDNYAPNPVLASKKPPNAKSKNNKNPPDTLKNLTVKLIAFMSKRVGQRITITELENNAKMPRRRIYDVVNILAGIGILTTSETKDEHNRTIRINWITMPKLIKLPHDVIKKIERDKQGLDTILKELKDFIKEVKENKDFKQFSAVLVDTIKEAFNTQEYLNKKIVLVETPEGTNIESRRERGTHRVRLTNLPEKARMYVIDFSKSPATIQKYK